MENLHLRRYFSLNILLRMAVLGIAMAVLLYWQREFLLDFYLRNQATATGYLINGGILILFLLGLIKMVAVFTFYAGEERALLRFAANLRDSGRQPLDRVDPHSIIARRYRTMGQLHQAHCPINHSALSSSLVAAESTRQSFPKFVSNVLILTGVFGTIVALSIALLGASDLLKSTVNVGGMGLVVHGMSTALNTTITAVVCYLFFSYFFQKLTDVQTNLLSGVEQITATTLIPRFHIQPESLLYEHSALIRSLQSLVNQMMTSQRVFQDLEGRLDQSLAGYTARIDELSADLGDLKQLLRAGFRLPEDA